MTSSDRSTLRHTGVMSLGKRALRVDVPSETSTAYADGRKNSSESTTRMRKAC